jgi:hypothetical protein
LCRCAGGGLAVWGATSVAAPFEHKGHHESHVKIHRQLRGQLAQMRVATAQYATDVEKAKADGYRIITPNMDDMGFHYLNPGIADFNVTKPPADPRLRRAEREAPAGRPRVGVPEEAEVAAAEGRDVRFLPGRLPLRRRNLYACILRG